MSREALVSHSDMPERGERVRFAEALAVFEDMHRALKARVAETPEHRALEGLDAALALVAGSTRAGHLDLGGFSAFRGSVELLNDNTPEARALDLFEGALRSMIASASDFDDLPDEDETGEDETDEDETGEDEIEEAIDEKNETDAADHAGIEMSAAPVIVALYEAAPEAPADEAPAPDEAPTDTHAGVPMETPPDAQPAEDAAPDAEADAETGPAEIEARILELEAELAEARAHQAA